MKHSQEVSKLDLQAVKIRFGQIQLAAIFVKLGKFVQFTKFGQNKNSLK